MRLCDVPESHRLGLSAPSSDAAILGMGVGFGMGIFREGPAGGGGGEGNGRGGGGGVGEEGGVVSMQSSSSLSRGEVYPRCGPRSREPQQHRASDTYTATEENNEAS